MGKMLLDVNLEPGADLVDISPGHILKFIEVIALNCFRKVP